MTKRHPITCRTVRRRDARRAFTLLEVIISIALVLIIILGVNQVFALTSRAIGAGQALSEEVRNARSAQSIIVNDLSNAEIDRAPFFYLDSEVLVGFRNKADQLSDLDYNPTDTRPNVDRAVRTLDRNKNGQESDTGDLTPRAFLTSRTHRADMFKIFTRQSGRRQTGNKNSFTSGVSSSEQYVVYGHLRQPAVPNDLVTGRFPGIGPSGAVLQPTDNPNNFYAVQWVLGRAVFLLRDPELVGSQRIIRDTSTNPVQNVSYYGRGSSQYGATSDSGAPFTESSQATPDGTMVASELVQYTYYDLMGVPIERYRTDFLPKFIANGRQSTWHNSIAFRQTGYPAPSRPLTSQGVARTVPCFVKACTQFVVEYAGDFVTQDQTGAVTGIGGPSATSATDGFIDFNLAANGTRTIRWYGFPRDINNDGTIRMIDDVVPLRDYLPQQMLFERTVLAKATNYGLDAAVPENSHYRCVWGPDTAAYPRPKMIRIVMAIDDPAARLAREQFFEFVVELP